MFKVFNLTWEPGCLYLVEDEDGVQAREAHTKEYVDKLLAAGFVVYFNPGKRDFI